MGFDLTGYEKDNIKINSFAVSSFLAILSLIIIVVGIYFYLFMIGEKYTQQMYLEGGIEKTDKYKENQEQYLKSHNLKRGMQKALDYYND